MINQENTCFCHINSKLTSITADVISDWCSDHSSSCSEASDSPSCRWSQSPVWTDGWSCPPAPSSGGSSPCGAPPPGGPAGRRKPRRWPSSHSAAPPAGGRQDRLSAGFINYIHTFRHTTQHTTSTSIFVSEREQSSLQLSFKGNLTFKKHTFVTLKYNFVCMKKTFSLKTQSSLVSLVGSMRHS